MSIGIYLIWLLITSGLLTLTWNRVMNVITKVKAVKYWQALLFLLTVSALCLPCAMKSSCGWAKKEHCAYSSDSSKGDCPYSHKNSEAPKEHK
jgi:hypothetical protein